MGAATIQTLGRSRESRMRDQNKESYAISAAGERCVLRALHARGRDRRRGRRARVRGDPRGVSFPTKRTTELNETLPPKSLT